MDNEKIVNFNEFCGSCKHENESEHNDICDECLSNPVNIDSRKPVNFESKK